MNRTNKQVSLDQAAALIRDNQVITLGGTLSQRIPSAFVRQLARRKVRGLELINSSPGYDIDVLAAAGCVARVRSGMATMEQPFGMAPNFRRAVEQGRLKVIEMGCPGVMASLQAAAFGLPFQAVAGYEGSDMPKLNEFAKVKDPFSDEEVYVVPRIPPDWAVLHVNEAAVRGNARIYGTPVWDRLMSRAARRCIIVTEKILPTAHFVAQPEMTVIPEIFVEAVVHAPNGAWPTAVFPDYGIDEAAMRSYLELSVSPGGIERYLEETLEHDCAEVAA